MADYKCSVQTLNGGLYFHIYKNDNTVILISLSNLTSSSLITITNYTHTKSENLSQNSTISTLVFNVTTYPLTLSTQIATPFTPSLAPLFVTFSDRTSSYSESSIPSSIPVEGPCTMAASSFSYTLSPASPSWLTYSPTGTTSTQTFSVSGSPLASVSLVTYSG